MPVFRRSHNNIKDVGFNYIVDGIVEQRHGLHIFMAWNNQLRNIGYFASKLLVRDDGFLFCFRLFFFSLSSKRGFNFCVRAFVQNYSIRRCKIVVQNDAVGLNAKPSLKNLNDSRSRRYKKYVM